jgi:hypothetical protein
VLKVHREKRGVVEPVKPPQPVIELNAVQNPRTVIKAEDVIGE